MASNLQNPNNIDFCEVISESKRIVISQKRHFYSCSLLFLFPLSLFTILFLASEKTLIISFLFTLFAIIFSFCAIATITYSSFHGYEGQPIDLFSSISSIFPLCLPFLSTSSLLLIILAFIFTCVGLFLVLIYKGILLLGFDISLNSSYFVIPYISIMIGAGIYLDMKWMLANVIVVVEGKRCYEALRKSAYLVEDLKGVILKLQLLSAAPVGLCLWYCSTNLPKYTGLDFAIMWVYYSGFLTVWLLHSLVRNVVVYVQCKGMVGEFLDDLPL